jgi:hypothetical protein
MSKIAP